MFWERALKKEILYLDSTCLCRYGIYGAPCHTFPTDTVRRGQIKLAGNELVMKDKILEAAWNGYLFKGIPGGGERGAAYHPVRLLRSPGNTYNIERGTRGCFSKSKMTLAQNRRRQSEWYFSPRYPSSLAALEKERLPSSKLFFRYLNVWKK